MGERAERMKRRKRNKFRNPYGRGYFQKWDQNKGEYYWARGQYDHVRKRWMPGRARVKPTARLYFAYGSNLNRKQMSIRCPEAKPFGQMILPNHRLVFRGVADIERAEGHQVQGGLWTITGGDEWALDIYEGVASKLYLKEYLTIQYEDADTGKTVVEKVLVYVMGRTRVEYAPNQGYLDTILEGYKDFGLDEAPLREVVANTPEPEWRKNSYSGSYYGQHAHWSDHWSEHGTRKHEAVEGGNERGGADADGAAQPLDHADGCSD